MQLALQLISLRKVRHSEVPGAHEIQRRCLDGTGINHSGCFY